MSRKKLDPVDKAFEAFLALSATERLTFSAMVRAAERAVEPASKPAARKPSKKASEVVA